MRNKISKFITGFRKLHVIQHSMVTMIENWRKVLQKKEITIVCWKGCIWLLYKCAKFDV